MSFTAVQTLTGEQEESDPPERPDTQGLLGAGERHVPLSALTELRHGAFRVSMQMDSLSFHISYPKELFVVAVCTLSDTVMKSLSYGILFL